MKPRSLFINAARGMVVDTESLREHILSGHIAGAALDVFPVEPKAQGDAFESPLRGLDNVILTPHVGGSTQEAQEEIGYFVAGKLAGVRAGGPHRAVGEPARRTGAAADRRAPDRLPAPQRARRARRASTGSSPTAATTSPGSTSPPAASRGTSSPTPPTRCRPTRWRKLAESEHTIWLRTWDARVSDPRREPRGHDGVRDRLGPGAVPARRRAGRRRARGADPPPARAAVVRPGQPDRAGARRRVDVRRRHPRAAAPDPAPGRDARRRRALRLPRRHVGPARAHQPVPRGHDVRPRGGRPAAVDAVRAIHDRVVGVLDDGTPYAANDPHLLGWVHVAEVDSFLRAHTVYGRRPAGPARTATSTSPRPPRSPAGSGSSTRRPPRRSWPTRWRRTVPSCAARPRPGEAISLPAVPPAAAAGRAAAVPRAGRPRRSG